MHTLHTSRNVPRRWDIEVGGIRWLPRMIDKARMQLNGKLGGYLMGQSPVDKALLKRLQMSTGSFIAVVRQAPDDEAVLYALRRKGFDEESVGRWSNRFPQTYKAYIPLWDLDEGYTKPNLLQKIGLAFFRVVEQPLMALVRKCVQVP